MSEMKIRTFLDGLHERHAVCAFGEEDRPHDKMGIGERKRLDEWLEKNAPSHRAWKKKVKKSYEHI